MNKMFRDLIPWNNDRKEAARTIALMSDNPFLSLQRDLNRAFDVFWNETGARAPFSAAISEMMPHTDMVESDSSVEISAELPGMSEKDIEISISDDVLSIHGEKKAEKTDDKKGHYLSERSFGVIHRNIALPNGVDSSKAEARFKDGVLTITMPKTAGALKNTRHIAIKSA